MCTCRCLRHNISDQEFEDFTAAYDQYRRSLTANRIALYANTMPEIVADWAHGFSAKYEIKFDVALRLMLQGGKHYLHSSLARSGAGWDPVKLDMCAFHLHPHVSFVCGRGNICIGC